jgi:hypothetical protein
MAHPYHLFGKIDPAMRRFELWAKTRDVGLTNPRYQAEAVFAYLPVYPRPTLGPDQRFLTKGGYVLPIKDGVIETANAAWIRP